MPVRKNIDEDFPLRGFIHCKCGTPLTASWSKGNTKRYPYYLCHNRQCDEYGKSIRRADLEGEFEELLKSLVPPEALFRIGTRMFKLGWEAQRTSASKRAQAVKAKLHETERDMRSVLDRIVQASVPDVIAALEKRYAALNADKLLLEEKMTNVGAPRRSFEDTLRTACEFLKNPANSGLRAAWTSDTRC